jgi:hypothetical protein
VTTYIYHHLGLGDSLILNGLVRTLISPKEQYVLFAKYHNHASVSFMYHDLPNVYVQAVENDAEVDTILKGKENVIRIGFNNVNVYGHIPFDLTFYRQMNVPYEVRWSGFKYQRDRIEAERELYYKLGLNDDLTLGTREPYIFVHDEEGKGVIQSKYLEGKQIITPMKGLTDNIFDYIYTIERASEVHCIDSAFMLLVDSLGYLSAPQYFHKYARSYVPSVYNPVPLCNTHWKVIEE